MKKILMFIGIILVLSIAATLYFTFEEKSAINCENIRDERVKDGCIAGLLIKNKAQCDNYPNENNCLISFAVSRGDESICNDKEDDQFKFGCYSALAVAEEKISLCDKIKEVDIGNDEIQPEDAKYFCYTDVAVEIGDSSICTNILHEEFQDYCYGKVSEVSLDVSSCAEIDKQSDREWCYHSIAVETKYLSLCEQIVDEGRKRACVQAVAIASEDESLCELVSVGAERDFCYRKVAEKKQDSSICDKIINSFDKNSCYQNIE